MDKLSIRPYARLLTMLGDQLIKNEKIAVLELVKNSYDADADWVKLSFNHFTESGEATELSTIVIEDNGCGMSSTTIREDWMSPATANKYSKEGDKRSPIKHRVIQGEKGIGRYAMLKLGRKIDMYTRPLGEVNEYNVCLDFANYGDDYNDKDGNRLYLDQLSFDLKERTPIIFVFRQVDINNHSYTDNEHGTRLVISDIRGKWSLKKIQDITNSFVQFGNVFSKFNEGANDKGDFEVGTFLNGAKIGEDNNSVSISLNNLFDTNSVLKIEKGHYEDSTQQLSFNINGLSKTLLLSDKEIKGTKVYKDQFYDAESKTYREVSHFGNFDFTFYVFDFNAKEPSKYTLSPTEKDLLKKHRVYLMRDGVRVLPYGDPDDDWLQIDVGRGTISAGAFFSNDQLVGQIEITKHGNPHLKDKTNREGLIEDENYTNDFICIVSSFLSYLRTQVYKEYLKQQQKKKDINEVKKKTVEKNIADLKDYFKDNKTAQRLISTLEKSYKVQYEYMKTRTERTESLAGVGLSVETSSHDMMLMMGKGMEALRNLYKSATNGNVLHQDLVTELLQLIGIFSYVQSQMKDQQMLFTSSKQRRRNIRVRPLLDKVIQLYGNTLSKNNIDCDVIEEGSPLIARCTDADLLQLFINLIDNSIYWLKVKDASDKKIIIKIDGNAGILIFSDNGPGVDKDDAPYIFEPFFSAKGEDGRGLGLYISRKLMERNDYSIELADIKEEKLLSGANFVVSFVKQED